jgi:hypothetical protein
VEIFQHSLQFLQSESFQTHVGTIHRRAIDRIAHHNGTSAYSPSLTCHLPAPTIGCLYSNDSLTTLTSSFQVPLYHYSISIVTPPFTLLCYYGNATNSLLRSRTVTLLWKCTHVTCQHVALWNEERKEMAMALSEAPSHPCLEWQWKLRSKVKVVRATIAYWLVSPPALWSSN